MRCRAALAACPARSPDHATLSDQEKIIKKIQTVGKVSLGVKQNRITRVISMSNHANESGCNVFHTHHRVNSPMFGHDSAYLWFEGQ